MPFQVSKPTEEAMTKHVQILGATLALGLLAACGGGGGTTSDDSDDGSILFPGPGNTPPGETPLIPPEQEATERVFSDNAGSVSDVFNSDGSLFMRDKSRVSVAKSYTGALNYRYVDAQLSLKAEGDDLVVTMRVDGATQPFVVTIRDARNLTRERITVNNTPIGDLTFYMRGGDISDLFDPASRRYAQPLEVVLSNRGQDFAIDTMGVIGTETRDERIGTLGASNVTATYSGNARMNIRRTDLTFDQFNATATGRLNLTANFGGGSPSVSGTVDRIRVVTEENGALVSDVNPAGNLIMSPAAISGNGFAGTMSADPTLAANSPMVGTVATGTYSGAFYGPNAEEIGGSMQGPDPVGTSDFIGFGYFIGQQP
jgi:hypothetical protein